MSSLAWLTSEAKNAWQEYAWLGSAEASWVLENFSGKLSPLAPPLLQHIPQRAIPKLLAEAIEDQRDALHSHPDHPLRQLQDWVKRAYPLTVEVIRRRTEILKGTKGWLTDNPDQVVGYRAMLFAMIPYFEDILPAPGSGKTIQYRSGCLTKQELLDLQPIWKEIIECTTVVDVPDLHVFLPTIRSWLHPSCHYSEETHAVMTSFAKEMISDIKEIALDDIGVRHALDSLIHHSDPDLSTSLDKETAILYPIEQRDADWEKEEDKWKQDADALAGKLLSRGPISAIEQLEPIELALSQAWPRLTPHVCHRIAEKSEDPLEWFDAMLATTLPADTVMPFVTEAIAREMSGWKLAVRACFETERLRGIAVHIILSNENVPEDLKQAALGLASQYTFIVERLVRSNQLPREILRELFRHPDKALVGKLAIAGQPRKDVRTVADDIRSLWEQAIVEYCEDDYWLGAIFKAETKLGLRWLKRKLCDDSFRPYHYRRSIESVLTGLTLDERRDLLGIVPDEYSYNDMIAGIVGDNLELYELLLQQSYREKTALLSPLHRSLDSIWEAFAKLAHEYDYSAEEIIECTFARTGSVFSWVGNYSDVWQARRKQFQDLKDHDDESIRNLADVGYSMSLENFEYWKKREDDESVYGRDRN